VPEIAPSGHYTRSFRRGSRVECGAIYWLFLRAPDHEVIHVSAYELEKRCRLQCA
jgi:hypothetical protein